MADFLPRDARDAAHALADAILDAVAETLEVSDVGTLRRTRDMHTGRAAGAEARERLAAMIAALLPPASM